MGDDAQAQHRVREPDGKARYFYFFYFLYLRREAPKRGEIEAPSGCRRLKGSGCGRRSIPAQRREFDARAFTKCIWLN
jgi:hypothetical protein